MNLAKPQTLPKPQAKTNAGTKGEPPVAASIVNLQKPAAGKNTTLQFQVPPEVRRAFKSYAAERDMSLSDLFTQIWESYRANNP